MGIGKSATGSIVAIAPGALALACTASVDPAAVVMAVEANLRDQGLEVSSVSCPEAGLPVRCEATLSDETVVAMSVARVGDGDGLTISSVDPIVVVARLVPEVRAKLEDVGHAVDSVRCEGQVWRTGAGAVGRCEMTDQDGARWVYEATFSGAGSQHRAKIYAAEPEPGGQGVAPG